MSDKNSCYFKQDFLNSDLFKKYKDLLNALLLDDVLYSKAEVEKMIKKYLEGVI